MVEAPEKIWLIETDKYNPYRVSCSIAPHSSDESTEYLRADIAASQLAEARAQSDRFGDKYLAALKRAEAAEAERDRLAADNALLKHPINMQDVRLAVGEGKLSVTDILVGVNAELSRRAALAGKE